MKDNEVIALAEAIKVSVARSEEIKRQQAECAEREYAQEQITRDLKEKLAGEMVAQKLKEAHGNGLVIKLEYDNFRTIPLVDPKDLPPEYQYKRTYTKIKISPNLTALKKDIQKQKPEALKVAKLERRPYVCISEEGSAFKPKRR